MGQFNQLDVGAGRVPAGDDYRKEKKKDVTVFIRLCFSLFRGNKNI